ncbi:MAG TPA: hypothetical protein VML91_19810 [Burkholderiales bacterium]|nr:hypothetical protein [Burkholderiales bacterium]
MKRIVIALATLIGFSGVAFANPTLDIGTAYSKVEATSYIAPASLPERNAQLATQP